jgi:hypothetical protein
MEDTYNTIMQDNIDQTPPDRESIQHWENLRSILIDWKKRMKVSDEEIALGLGIGRQAVNKFINGSNPTLPVYRNNLIRLHKYITDEDRIESIKSEDAKTNRRKLLEDTANNILEKSGFLGIKRISIITDELSTSDKFHRLIFRLSNKSLNGRDIWNIEELVINQLAQSQSNTEEQKSFERSEIKKWLGQRHENIEEYWGFVKSTLKRYERLGRKKFTEAEVLELFQNIAENKVSRKDKALNIRVVRCETRTFNSVYRRLRFLDPSSDRKIGIDKVLEAILNEGIRTENLLRDLQEGEISFNPINEVRLHCTIGNSSETLWFYRSCSSSTGNMISAIQEGMGHDLELKDLSSHVLAEGSDSIVRVSAILKSDSSFYVGRWVDIDMILSFAQAVAIASEDWAKDKVSHRETYYKMCAEFSDILEKIDVLIGKTYEYGLVHTNNTIEKKIHPITAFSDCIKQIDGIITDYLSDKSGTYNHYASILKKNKRQAQLAISRYYHVVGNLEKAKIMLNQISSEIEIEIEKDGEDLFDSTIILFEVEQMTFNFYTSKGEFFDGKLWHEKLVVLESNIKKYLRRRIGVSLLTDSLYRSLSELYGNISRFEFYNCDNKKHNIERLKQALKYSQRAAYFAMKADDEKRASHWLARCGRILCRLDDSTEAENYIRAAEAILQRSITSEHQYKKRSEALKLEINIATGERLLSEDNSKEAIGYFILALEGAIYLQFARIMAGSLYGLYRASEHNIDLNKVADQLKNLGEKIKKEEKEREGKEGKDIEEKIDNTLAEDNIIFSKTIKFLQGISTSSSDGEPKIFQREELKDEAISIWNSWAKLSGDDTLHFISKHMKENTFLSVIKDG